MFLGTRRDTVYSVTEVSLTFYAAGRLLPPVRPGKTLVSLYSASS